MDSDYLIVLGVIAALSIVQSVFGMGILVFGTPTLILMGYDFFTTLQYLLPASVAISLIQTITSSKKGSVHKRALVTLCIPAICIGLAISSSLLVSNYVELAIGMMLLSSAGLRIYSPLEMRLRKFIRRNMAFTHFLMGIVHGVTNLGGAILAVYAAAINKNKQATRHAIATYYLVFGIIQILMLSLMGQYSVMAQNYVAPIISSLVYIVAGNRVFMKIDDAVYYHALTTFIALYGIVIIVHA
ncbi:MAG: sulfite exporter TauE/SafE family protein [Rhodospirillales bacterium]|jgi:uncharacterized protein|nr:sulfite exporter TauE/SafE family protein [Rhodospirillales bacterium]MBT4039728.1 sulfite exporter TauE/SafE family protein [Rhodospirillales bacterium]MBT4626155.1 sulfite exporter TauE/SafE family protein [Rhodospirillales bacterium]MBT5350257.1 sulfite exporter TauE/SafE family protein [Rhodospirillales bacterium]MBT5522295.1 sulfite exporter TauE/SafE family protein [Rhodospirillales bacterium]